MIPVEVVRAVKHMLLVAAAFFVLAGLSRSGFDMARMLTYGSGAAVLIVLSSLGGCVLTPILLAWLPGRAFSIKGTVVGLLLAAGAMLAGWIPGEGLGGRLETAAWFLMIPAISAFLAMNFTGASTHTSLSGVKREMRIAVPVQIGVAVVGLGLLLAARFV